MPTNQNAGEDDTAEQYVMRCDAIRYDNIRYDMIPPLSPSLLGDLPFSRSFSIVLGGCTIDLCRILGFEGFGHDLGGSFWMGWDWIGLDWIALVSGAGGAKQKIMASDKI